MPALAIRNPSFTLSPSAGGIVPAAMLGGTPANPLPPVIAKIAPLPATYGATADIQPDSAGKFLYVSDGYGNIYLVTLATGTAAQIYASPYGNSVTALFMMLSLNGSALYERFSNGVIVSISTAAPYTATVVVGTAGTTGTADGTGAAATLSATSDQYSSRGLAAYGPDGLIYFIDNVALVRTVNPATWAVSTVRSTGAMPDQTTALHIGATGDVYYSDSSPATLHRMNLVSGAVTTLGTFSESGQILEWTPDSRKPSERCVYAVNESDANLIRFDTNTGVFTTIAVLAGARSGSRSLIFRNNSLYAMTTAGIYQITAS